MVWHLGTFGSRCRATMAAASMWVRQRSNAASLYLSSSLGLSPIRRLGATSWAGACAFGRLVRWVLVPKSDAPLDVLKHYVSVLIVLIGAGALLWSAKQIAYPPLVITVAKLPEPLEKEYWLNPELSRTLIGEIERLRAVADHVRKWLFPKAATKDKPAVAGKAKGAAKPRKTRARPQNAASAEAFPLRIVG